MPLSALLARPDLPFFPSDRMISKIVTTAKTSGKEEKML